MSRFVPDLVEMRYHDTYWYSQVVFRTLASGDDYARTLNEFFGDDNYPRFLRSFPRWTTLHDYILFAVQQVEFEERPSCLDDDYLKWRDRDYGPTVTATPLEAALVEQNIEHIRFEDWVSSSGKDLLEADDDDFANYYSDLGEFDAFDDKRFVDGPRGRLHERLCDEVFFLAFMNRGLLLALHTHVAFAISDLSTEELAPEFHHLFSADSVLKRTHIPKWARSAVFFRDRGRCVLCNQDLSRILSLQNESNYDHIVPLARSGINDVSNLQLLCSNCNRQKGANDGTTRNVVERWF